MPCALLLALAPAASWSACVPALAAMQEEGQDGATQKPTPEEAEQGLQEAWKAKDAGVLRSTIETLGRVADPGVTKLVARALEHEQAAVRVAAVRALRWNEDPSALERLLRAHREKELIEDPDSGAAWVYALGQKADARALEVIADGLSATGNEDRRIRRARILALGRIRAREACEALVQFCWSGPAAARRHARELRTSLIVLTGVDAGKSGKEWVDWWNEHGSDLEIGEDPWPLPTKRQQRAWDELWMSPEEKERRARERREQREEEQEEEKEEDDDGGGEEGDGDGRA